jgi:hypothetical protein
MSRDCRIQRRGVVSDVARAGLDLDWAPCADTSDSLADCRVGGPTGHRQADH